MQPRQLVRAVLLLTCIAALALPAVAGARPAGGAFARPGPAKTGHVGTTLRSDGSIVVSVVAGSAVVLALIAAGITGHAEAPVRHRRLAV